MHSRSETCVFVRGRGGRQVDLARRAGRYGARVVKNLVSEIETVRAQHPGAGFRAGNRPLLADPEER